MTDRAEPVTRVSRYEDEPVYREVEEHGRTKLVLMRKVSIIEDRPAFTRLVLTGQTDDTLTYEAEYVPAQSAGHRRWEKV